MEMDNLMIENSYDKSTAEGEVARDRKSRTLWNLLSPPGTLSHSLIAHLIDSLN